MYVELKDSEVQEKRGQQSLPLPTPSNTPQSPTKEPSTTPLLTSSAPFPPSGRPLRSNQFFINDLDRFLWALYKYWHEGGYYALLASHLTHVAVLMFTLFFPLFLIFFVNWGDILYCSSNIECGKVNVFKAPTFPQGWFPFFFLLYLIIPFCVLLVWHCIGSYRNVMDARISREFVRNVLHIYNDETLKMLDWTEIVALLLKVQEISPFCRVDMNLTALDIAQIIMRQENYVIAITNRGLLTEYTPKWFPDRIMYSNAIFWNIRMALFASMFDRHYRINLNDYTPFPRSVETQRGGEGRKVGDYMQRPKSVAAARLAANFKILAVLNALFIIPSVLFVLFYFFLKHSQDFRLNASAAFTREFNSYALWVFREFNELPHQLDRRLSLAASWGDKYIYSAQYSPVMQRIKMILKYVLGALLAVLIFPFFIFDETPLLFVVFFGRNLMWYIVLFGFVYSIVQNYQVNHYSRISGEDNMAANAKREPVLSNYHSTPYLSPLDLYVKLMSFVGFTHYLPASWRRPSGIGALNSTAQIFSEKEPLLSHDLSAIHKVVVNDMCSQFFNLHITVLLEELLGAILTPLALLLWLPPASNGICHFIYRSTCVGSTGDFCVFSNLDIVENGNLFYNAPNYENRENLAFFDRMPFLNEASDGFDKTRIETFGGKLEKSLLLFVLYYRLPPPYYAESPVWSILDSSEMKGSLSDTLEITDVSFISFQNASPHESFEGVFWRQWGYTQSAVDFLNRLENFQSEQLQLYPYYKRMLPADYCSPLAELSNAGNWTNKPQELCACSGPSPLSTSKISIFYFWLERFFEIKSGRVFYPTTHINRMFALQLYSDDKQALKSRK